MLPSNLRNRMPSAASGHPGLRANAVIRRSTSSVLALTGLSVLALTACQNHAGPDADGLSAEQDTAKGGGTALTGADVSSAHVQDGAAQRVEAQTIINDGCGRRVTIDASPFAMRLEKSDGTRLSGLASGGLRLGVVGSLDPNYNYDPFYFYQKLLPKASQGPKGLTWLSASSVYGVTTTTLADGRVQTDLTLTLSNGGRADLTITPQCQSSPSQSSFKLAIKAETLQVAYMGLDFESPSSERYYGLGEYFDSVEHRGKIRAMQLEYDLSNEDYYNQAHVPVPFFTATSGWGLFVEDDHPGIFDMASTNKSAVRVEYGSPSLIAHWMASDKPASLVEAYTRLTSAPAVPPVWAFAPIHWRDETAGQDMVLEDTAAIRANKIPGNGEWLDRPYETYISSMDLDPAKYPDGAGMVNTLHANGFRMAGWNVPYLDYNDPDFDLAKRSGWFVGGYTTQQKWGPMMDFTHPEAMAFWQDRVSAAIDIGFDGWKMDYGEDILNGLSTVAVDFSFYNGQVGSTMHHRYSDYYHRAYQEPYGGEDMFMLSRAGAYGGQKYTSVIWPGDLCNNFALYGEDHHVGGLPAAVIAGTSLAASGYPFYASDTGGYQHGRPTAEVLSRWVQYSAWLPIMQYGGCGDINPSCNPWDLSDQGASTFTQASLDNFRTFAQLHTELFPFFYSLAERAKSTGTATSTAYGLYWPADGHHPNDQFVVGDAIMVAPLVTGGTSRTVYVPSGRMIDLNSGLAVTGPTTLTVAAAANQVPVYLLDGAIVPMLRPGVQSLLPVQDTTVDSYAADAGRIWGYIVPGNLTSRFKMPFDGGELSASASANVITVSYARSQAGTRHTGLNMRVYAPSATRATLQNGTVLTQVSPGATATCSACFARETGSPWIWLGLGNLNSFTATLQ